MTKIYDLPQIKSVLKDIDVIGIIEEGFVAYSQGRVVVPPVGEMVFKDPPGDVHIKYGYILGDDYYIIKVASGFYENDKLGLPSGSGLMLIFSQKTGILTSILLDEGYLTDVRTAAAGAVAAKFLAPKNIECIGILGTGVQGHMQLEYLESVTPCRQAAAWGRNREKLSRYKEDMEARGFFIRETRDIEDITSACRLIVTATPSTIPLLHEAHIRPGTHITAVGSDTAEKHELDPKILQKADIVAADSLHQCLERGEIHQAMKAGLLPQERIVEMGTVIADKNFRRSSDEQVTVADLTGVAVQDIQIAKAVFKALESKKS